MKKLLHFLLALYIMTLITACVFEEESFLVKDPDLTPEITVLADSVEISTGAGFHDFGVLIPGNSSEVQTLTIKNDGTGMLTIKEVTIENDVDFSVSSDPDVPFDIEAGDSMTASIVFNPHTEADFETVTLSIVSDDTDESAFVYFLEGSGSYNGSPAEIAVAEGSTSITNNIYQYTYSTTSPTVAVDYSYVKKSTTNTTTYTITNSGTGNLTIDEVSVRNDPDNVFTITSQPSPGTIVVPGGTADFSVNYEPDETGIHSAWIKIDNGNIGVDDFAFYISGTGAVPVLQLQESNTAFSDDIYYHTICSTTQDHTASFRIVNTGKVPLEINSITLTDNTSQFSRALITALTGEDALDENEQSDIFTITFDPTAEGGYGETLTINNDSQTPVKSVLLRGATEAPYLPNSLKGWFDADEITDFSDGQYVNLWTDKIGGFKAEPYSTYPTALPKFEAGDPSVLNGHKCLEFTPVAGDLNNCSLLYYSGDIFTYGTGMTMFVVYQQKSEYGILDTNEMIVSWYDNSTGSDNYNWFRIFSTYLNSYTRPPTSGIYSHSFAQNNTIGTPYIWNITLGINPDSEVTDMIRTYQNGVELSSSNTYTTGRIDYKSFRRLYIGNYTGSFDRYGFDGYIAQIIIYNEKLDSEIMALIQDYLMDLFQ